VIGENLGPMHYWFWSECHLCRVRILGGLANGGFCRWLLWSSARDTISPIVMIVFLITADDVFTGLHHALLRRRSVEILLSGMRILRRVAFQLWEHYLNFSEGTPCWGQVPLGGRDMCRCLVECNQSLCNFPNVGLVKADFELFLTNPLPTTDLLPHIVFSHGKDYLFYNGLRVSLCLCCGRLRVLCIKSGNQLFPLEIRLVLFR